MALTCPLIPQPAPPPRRSDGLSPAISAPEVLALEPMITERPPYVSHRRLLHKVPLIGLMAGFATQHGIELGRLRFLVPENGLDGHKGGPLVE